jgi:hypothetical protein
MGKLDKLDVKKVGLLAAIGLAAIIILYVVFS